MEHVMEHVMDEVVEERIWRHGVEIISRVNWSHLGRLRRSLGLFGHHFENNPMQLGTLGQRLIAVQAEPEARPLVLRKRSSRREGREGSGFTPARKTA